MRYNVGFCRLCPHQLNQLLLLARHQCALMGAPYYTLDRIVLVSQIGTGNPHSIITQHSLPTTRTHWRSNIFSVQPTKISTESYKSSKLSTACSQLRLTPPMHNWVLCWHDRDLVLLSMPSTSCLGAIYCSIIFNNSVSICIKAL